jgi:hypothetical protein
VQNIESKREAKKELEDVLYITKQVEDIRREFDTLTNDQVISNYDYSKIEKLSKKVERLRNSKKLHEQYLYNLDDLVRDTDEIFKKICHVLVQELKNLIKHSAFFAKESTEEESNKDSRKVFMILKSFKQLLHSEEYVYRTINNDIIDPEFNKLVQKALKSKSVISLNDKQFDKSKLPLSIFIDGVMKIYTEGSLKNLIKMCHGKPEERCRPLSRQVYISGYDIILNCILEPTKVLLENKLSFVYSPGIQMIFRSNYFTVRTFVKSIISCGVKDSKGIISHIISKYNLPTYFTLVAREVIRDFATKLDSTLSKGKIETGEESLSNIVISTVNK